jgi:L,D-transpeptidase catalytic domain
MRGHAMILLATLACFVCSESAEAKLDILVDKATQRMLVIQDGYIRYTWPVSTGRDNMATPNGVYAPQRLERSWFSTAYYNSPMPFSIFFHNGYAIHGSYAIDQLGGPASHGCVRLHPHHAAILFDLVQQEGPSDTTIEITDEGRPQERPLPGREVAGEPARDIAPVPPRDIAAGAGDIPPLPRVVRYRENGDVPEPLPAPRANRPLPARSVLQLRPVQASHRILADVRPSPNPPRAPAEAAVTNPASAPARPPGELPDSRSRPRTVEASKVAAGPKAVDGPKVAEGSAPESALPAPSTSSFKLLPASCWSGGASRWQWWTANQGNQCK